MNYIQLFEQFEKNSLGRISVDHITHTIIREYLATDNVRVSKVEDVEKAILSVIETFDILQQQGNEVILYRVLDAYDESHINMKSVGQHFVAAKRFVTPELCQALFVDLKRAYILTCRVYKKDIHVLETLAHNADYWWEKEVTLKYGTNATVLKIEKLLQ